MIVVCNLVQYAEFNGEIQKQHGTILRKGVKIPDAMVAEYNESHRTTQYEIDDLETKKYAKVVAETEKKQLKKAEENVN